MFNKLFLEKTEIKIETDEEALNFIFPKDFGLTDPTVINGVEIKWTYKSVNEEPNEFDIEIKGLTNTTVAKIKLKNSVRLVAGYGADIGEVASGIITRKEMEKGTLKLKCREVPADFKKLVSAAYAPNTTASTIINDLASKCGFTVKQCELKNDKVYSIGESILGSGLYEIGQIVKDCDSQMTTKNDFIYIYHNEINTEKVIKLSYQSGLLEEPKPQNVEEISYKVEKTEESKGKKGSKKTSKGGKKSGKTATKKASKNSKKSKK
nr:MAG TPA: major tail protein [Caudoviricetes sp.]